MPDAFAPGPSHPSAAPLFAGAALLDAEKLRVYQLAVEFQTLSASLVPRQRGVLLATLRDQLDRASVSIVLNIAERWPLLAARQGSLRRHRPRQRHRVRRARRSASCPPPRLGADASGRARARRSHRPDVDSARRQHGRAIV